jgi:hypothetical protein
VAQRGKGPPANVVVGGLPPCGRFLLREITALFNLNEFIYVD